VKALSLWQPWASLIALGVKTIETRSWATWYRGPLLIHAAKKRINFARDVFADLPFADQLAWGEVLKEHGIRMDALPYGKVVASVNLDACVMCSPETVAKISSSELPFGNFEKGRFMWMLSNCRPVEPYDAVGRQGVFDLEATKA